MNCKLESQRSDHSLKDVKLIVVHNLAKTAKTIFRISTRGAKADNLVMGFLTCDICKFNAFVIVNWIMEISGDIYEHGLANISKHKFAQTFKSLC